MSLFCLFRKSVGRLFLITLLVFGLSACTSEQQADVPAKEPSGKTQIYQLSDAEIENIVRRSYQYVVMYNVNNKGAMDPNNPANPGGWNKLKAITHLFDHNVKMIARPNNDTFYAVGMLDLTREPVILVAPKIDSDYASLMATGYDHYVNIPLSSRDNDFAKPTRVLFYSERTPGYNGEVVEGVDKVMEMDGDFVSAVYRVMPHMNEPEKLATVREAMGQIRLLTLSEYQGGQPAAATEQISFPAYGATDADLFENNLLEVMQFVFNHTTFDPENELDLALLAAYKPLGVAPGQAYDASKGATIDGARFRATAERVKAEALENRTDPEFIADHILKVFLPKGQMDLETLIFQSVVGPIGQPFKEAVYPQVLTVDGKPMTAMNDYIIRMSRDELPPALAFWSLTLYDTENGFFIPNDRKKYSVGQNAGMKLDDEGGITIHISAERPQGAPVENWLPISRGDYGIDLGMRLYTPDLERFKDWQAPLVAVRQ